MVRVHSGLPFQASASFSTCEKGLTIVERSLRTYYPPAGCHVHPPKRRFPFGEVLLNADALISVSDTGILLPNEKKCSAYFFSLRSGGFDNGIRTGGWNDMRQAPTRVVKQTREFIRRALPAASQHQHIDI
jgi:hypothetical protein